MNDDERDRQWQCAVCKDWKVVPHMARACEAKHEKEGTT